MTITVNYSFMNDENSEVIMARVSKAIEQIVEEVNWKGQPVPVLPKTVPFSIANIKNAEHCNTEWENERTRSRVKDIMEQREEVLSAFIAKYGFEPDRFVQIQDGVEWSVRRMSDEEMKQRKDRHL